MALHPETKFPNRLSYVLKLRRDTTPDAPAGRLENIVTGRRLEFGSARELLEAIAREIEAGESDAGGG
jgi:hypothetical protein